MAQQYTNETAMKRMSEGKCPECGELPDVHIDDQRFWIPRDCDLRPDGVRDRISSFELLLTTGHSVNHSSVITLPSPEEIPHEQSNMELVTDGRGRYWFHPSGS